MKGMWIGGWIAGWRMDAWLDGWMDGRADGWMDGWMEIVRFLSTFFLFGAGDISIDGHRIRLRIHVGQRRKRMKTTQSLSPREHHSVVSPTVNWRYQ